MTAGELLAAALSAGVPVFPCGFNKKPCIAKREGGRGFHDATRDPEALRKLFAHQGARMIGTPTGETTFDVLDLDYRKGAAVWEKENLHRLPETCTHETQHGGRHLLFIHAPGVCNSESKIAKGVDVRGQGGYVVMPPSPGYRVISDAEIVHWPDWLLELVLKAGTPPKPQRPRSSAATQPVDDKRLSGFISKVVDRVRHAAEGQKHYVLRNSALSLGGIQAAAGFSDETAISWLTEALPATVEDWKNAEATAAWGLRAGRERPIELEDRPHSARSNGKDRPRERPGRKAPDRSPARHAESPDGDIAPAWTDQLVCDDHGKPIPDLANVMISLREAPELSGLLAYDEMARTPVLLRPVPGAKNTTTPHPLNDVDVAAIQNWMQRAGLRRLAKDVVHQATELQAVQQRFHPVRDYLNSLTWDGQNRLDIWLTYYLGVERTNHDDPIGRNYVDAVGRMFMISAVARIFEPGCQCDYMLVLEGPQGNLKSSACAVLAGEWFSDHLPDLHISQKDVSQHLNGKWIVEIPELAALLKADKSAIKSFISRRVERYRRSYGRRDVFEPRQCVFIGTTNQAAYLRDPTGGRRFWPVIVVSIALEALKRDRDQLWAEAVQRYRRGERWWPDAEFEREQIQAQQEARFDEDAWTEVIRHHLNGLDRTTVMRVAVALGFTNDRVGTRDARRISAILERLGWVRQRDMTGRWWVPVLVASC